MSQIFLKEETAEKRKENKKSAFGSAENKRAHSAAIYIYTYIYNTHI